MTGDDGSFELSRRKALGTLGTIGAASVGAGVGTSAYFSDAESYDTNTLTAGALDLKVDWEEHYWNDFDVEGVTVERVAGADDVRGDQVGLPDPLNPMIAVDDIDTFMDATAIEAYPDADDDGSQDDLAEYDACADFADTPEDLDPEGLRSDNEDTRTADGVAPLVNLTDVKPGDFGELTLSFHLCDNPGFVWLQGELVDADESGISEPEADTEAEIGPGEDDPATRPLFDTEGDERDDPGSTDPSETRQEPVELLDAIRTLLWYDEDGDNVYEPGREGEPVDLAIVFDQSESMNAVSGSDDTNPEKLTAAVSGATSLVDTVGETTNQTLVYFSDPDATRVIRELGSQRTDIKRDLEDLDGPDDPSNPLVDDNQPGVRSEGNGPQVDSDGDGRDDDNLIFETDLEGGIREAHDELVDGSNARSDARKIMVLLTDGRPFTPGKFQNPTDAASDAKADDVEIFTIAYGSGADGGLMATIASDPVDTHAFSGDEADIENIFGQIGTIIAGEEAFFRGSLRELLRELESGHGIPLDGNRETFFDEVDDPDDHETRDHFVNSTNDFIGLAWWVPRSVGNAVQGDSVSFDLGFYTEQARHNDGGDSTTN